MNNEMLKCQTEYTLKCGYRWNCCRKYDDSMYLSEEDYETINGKCSLYIKEIK